MIPDHVTSTHVHFTSKLIPLVKRPPFKADVREPLIVLASRKIGTSTRLEYLEQAFSPHTKAAPIQMRLGRYPCLLFTSASIGAFPTRKLRLRLDNGDNLRRGILGVKPNKPGGIHD